jgi:prepilin-type N-terminal cleavage/methylation domain-containing protein
MKNFSKSIIQRGFSLIEMVVVLSIIAVLAVLFTTQFSGDKAKATKILSDMEAIKKAVLRFRMDTGEYPCDLRILLEEVPYYHGEATNPNRLCRWSSGASWAGPYLEKGIHQNGTHQIASGIEGADMFLTRFQRGWGGGDVSLGFPRMIMLYPVPRGVAMEFIKQCTGSEEWWVQNFNNGKCALNMTNGGTEWTLSYLIEFQK